MNLFKLFNKKEESKEDYFNLLVEEDSKNLYAFSLKYMNQEEKLLKMYGKAFSYNKKIRMIVISDTHNCLKEEEFREFVLHHTTYDLCLLLGAHSPNDILIILKYIENNAIVCTLLGSRVKNHNIIIIAYSSNEWRKELIE